MSTIKLDRAQRLAGVGQYNQTWLAIVANMPPSLLEHGTAKMIADVADAMRQAHQVGYSLGLSDGNPGRVTSERKAAAVRENGKKGGRPRKKK